jgi:DNA-binding MarR family transcriptional regulator
LTLGDYQVLVELSEAGERAMRMCDLAATLQLTPSGLTRRLDGLVRAGDVERVPAVHDRRVMLARLTEQGMARLVAAAPTHAASVRARFLDPVDPADQDALGRAFTAIRAALRSR